MQTALLRKGIVHHYMFYFHLAFQDIFIILVKFFRLHMVFSSPRHIMVAGGCLIVMEIFYKMDFSLPGFLICCTLLGFGMCKDISFILNKFQWLCFLNAFVFNVSTIFPLTFQEYMKQPHWIMGEKIMFKVLILQMGFLKTKIRDLLFQHEESETSVFVNWYVF